MRRIQEYEPEARYYLQEDSMLLMVGPSHDDEREQPLLENEADGVVLIGSSGGAW
jgi:hypothetical protein